MKSQTNQFDIVFKNGAVRDEPPVKVPMEAPMEAPMKVGYRVLLSDLGRRRRPSSGATITVAMALIGLLAGWIAGIALTGGFRSSRNAPETPADVVLPSQTPVDAQAGDKVVSPGSKSLRPRDASTQAQPPQDADAVDARAAKQEGDEKAQERETAEVPGREPSKEIGQAAMDKIVKENEKMKRGKRQKANKNDE